MSPQGASVEDRLMDLEIKMSFSDKLVGDLDDATRQLSADMVLLSREVARLRQLLESATREPRPPMDEKPPHF